MEKIIDGIKYKAILFGNDLIGWKLIHNYNNKSDTICIPDNIDEKPITQISASAFSLSHLKEIKIPDSVEIIETNAFRGNRKLELVTVYKSSYSSTREVLSLYSGVFEGCHKLKAFVCDKPVHLNGKDVFSDCFELFQVGNNNKIFGSVFANCFRNCVCLKELHILGTHCRLWTNCFYGCSNLQKIHFDCKTVYCPKAVSSFLLKKQILCVSTCSLAEMAYAGANVEIV